MRRKICGKVEKRKQPSAGSMEPICQRAKRESGKLFQNAYVSKDISQGLKKGTMQHMVTIITIPRNKLRNLIRYERMRMSLTDCLAFNAAKIFDTEIRRY
ncbi:14371_t:CDS:2 [Ambispora leptoticha]|uniref:14371_t:CDS:1 n=1 Tax=Ambispora leptoticha TaxID=144679 RepID=A0A9N8VGM1_9GLOM|nr:14371_t:CDS:2 [Ambispora leptoticha]